MPLAKAQRGDAIQFADGLFDMFAGVESDESDAASVNVAQILLLVANAHTDNKFTKG